MTGAFSTQVLAADDVPLMRRMLDLFGRAFDEPATYGGCPPDDAYLTALLGSETFVALAALEGPELVGGLAGYVLPKFEQRRSEFYLYDLAVDERHRRRGVATSLIRTLQEVAGARGIHVVFVQADHGDEPAIALYSKLGGRREEVLHFDIAPHEVPAATRITSDARIRANTATTSDASRA